VADGSRIRDQLGWQPRKPALETMIADAWEFHQGHPDGYNKSVSATSA
jgi:UDP-glucose 4-epimerase